MIDIDNLQSEVEKALNAFILSLYEITNVNHYISLSDEIKSRNSEITNKYINKRFLSIKENCPYPIKYNQYVTDEYDRGGKAFRGFAGRYIELNEDDPTTSNFESLNHEWAHQMLHLRSNAIKVDYFTEELEAETVSFIIGYIVGHIDEFSHCYIHEKFDKDFSIGQRIELLNQVFTKSEIRIKRAVTQILKKMRLTLGQINYHHKHNGTKLD